jgi:chloramphenicol O-acetyltransferase type A
VNRPEPIDRATWNRAEPFEYYRSVVPCTYAVTVEVDTTALTAALRRTRRKTYAAQAWALATVVNRHPEFRLALDDEGRPATWPVVHPSFTVLNPARETFAAVWTPYVADFAAFHSLMAELLDEHRGATCMFPQGELPPDTFDISSLPWISFTAFDPHLASGSDHFLPIFTLGRHVERDDRTFLPLAVQMHHAAADGFHVARLVNDLRDLVSRPDWA